MEARAQVHHTCEDPSYKNPDEYAHISHAVTLEQVTSCTFLAFAFVNWGKVASEMVFATASFFFTRKKRLHQYKLALAPVCCERLA